jgi:hypothetical protein
LALYQNEILSRYSKMEPTGDLTRGGERNKATWVAEFNYLIWCALCHQEGIRRWGALAGHRWECNRRRSGSSSISSSISSGTLNCRRSPTMRHRGALSKQLYQEKVACPFKHLPSEDGITLWNMRRTLKPLACKAQAKKREGQAACIMRCDNWNPV